MAGDWIKLEHATRRKPEVLLAAELLGISRREAIGLFLDYFLWLDEALPAFASRDAVVTHMSRRSFDMVLECAGFATTLEVIGWAKFDDDAHTLTVINASAHNGSAAKSRALARNRMKRLRDDSVTQTPSLEKRREEKNTKSKARASRKRDMPPNFSISERVRQWAADKGHDRLSERLEHFKGKALAKGYVYADWDEGFMGAIRDDWAGFNATAPPGNGVHATRQDTADQMHKRGKYARPADQPTDITGESERIT